MIEKIEQIGIKLRFVIFVLFIIAGLGFAVFYACEECEGCDEKTPPDEVLAFWPPDMVPHPHIPDPTPPPSGPVRG